MCLLGQRRTLLQEYFFNGTVRAKDGPAQNQCGTKEYNSKEYTARMLLETHHAQLGCNSHCIEVTADLFSVVLSL